MRWLGIVVVIVSVYAAGTPQVASADTLGAVRARGALRCGVSNSSPGFAHLDDKGVWRGFDVDYCHALAAAIFGDGNKVQFVPLVFSQAMPALQAGEVHTLSRITLRYTGRLIDLTTLPEKERDNVVRAPEQYVKGCRLRTTVGRVLFKDSLPKGLPFINGVLRKKGLQSFVHYCYLRHGAHKTVELVDSLKDLGFLYATRAGVSIGVDDMVVPPEKAQVVDRARAGQIEVEKQYLDGLITNRERYNKVIAI